MSFPKADDNATASAEAIVCVVFINISVLKLLKLFRDWKEEFVSLGYARIYCDSKFFQ